MSSPDNWGSSNYGQYDPNTGRPAAGNPGVPGQQPGTQYQGFGAFHPPPQQQFPQPPQQQFPQQPYPGMVNGFPEPPRKSRGPLIAAIALAAVAVIAIVTTIVVLSTVGGSEAAPPPPDTSRSMTPSRTSSSAPETSATSANSDLTSVVPGWQVVSVPRRSAIYDVPPNWEPDPNPDNIQAFGPPDDAVTMTGVADYQKGFCPGDANSFRATSGATARKGPDDTTVATETLHKFARLAYTRDGQAPVVAPGPPEQVLLGDGTTTGVRVTAQVTLTAPGTCDAVAVAISVLATNSNGESSVVFISAADQNGPDAVSLDTLNQMAQSLRGASA